MNLKITQLLITGAIILASAFSTAQLYKTTDEKGNTVFTDTPQAGVEVKGIEVQQTNTVRPVEPLAQETAEVQETAAVEDEDYYTSLVIVNPANDTIFPNGLVPTPVTARITPELKPNHQLRLLLDGVAVSSGNTSHFEIPMLNRGTQSLQVEVLDDDKVLLKSEPVIIHGFRPGGGS
jgi:hypothetical protein